MAEIRPTISPAPVIYTNEELSTYVNDLQLGVNIFFVFINGTLVFFMQAGFAFLEAGAVRAKNTNHILLKNALDTALSIIAFWMTGYAFLNGSTSNQFIGTSKFFLSDDSTSNYADFFYHLVYAAASTTILSGALAERGAVWPYAIFVVFMTGFIYPVSAHWAFCTGGWLFKNGFHDKSGSTVIHSCGGAGSLIAAIILGPRLGRFGANGKVIAIPGHSTALATLGFFILWFGFLSFNGMADGGIVGSFNQNVQSRAVINTCLSGAGGLLSALLIRKLAIQKKEYKVMGKEFKFVTFLGGQWSLFEAMNGSIAGCVAMCSGCDVANPWGGFVIGLGAGISYTVVAKLVLMMRIDDPLNAVALHWGGGAWGTIFLAFILPSDRLQVAPNGGIFYAWDGDAFKFWGLQMMGNAVIALWSILCCGLFFGIFRVLGLLRVSKEEELKGLDNAHGELAYASDPFAEGIPEYSDGEESDPNGDE